MEEYDPDTGARTTKASMPTDRWVFGAAVVNGRIYVIGGDTSGGQTSSVLEYNPITDIWTQKANMPIARAAHGVVVMRDRVYCIAGGVGSAGGPESLGFPTVWIYNPANDTWEISSDIPTPRQYSAVSIANGKIYAFGGFSDRICSTVEEFIPPVIVDFNSDGIVDCADICMMVDYWGAYEPMYDIAPHPSGDGIIDVQDLIVLAEHLFEEIPLAEPVE